MSTKDLDTDEVAEIYDELLKTYETEWAYRGHRSLHLAYYDDDHDEPGSAAMNTMRLLSEAAEVDSSDRILNIGCGAGEDSVWNAQAYGTPVIGVNISESQLEFARENAEEHGVEELTTFNYDNFQTLETVDDDSVTLVWGLEALSHSPDRTQALDSARRVLTEDGRVAFTDLFLRTPVETLSESDRKKIEYIDDALGLRIGDIDGFETTLRETGFENIEIEELTDGIKPCTKRRRKFARVAYPVGRVMEKLGLTTKMQINGLAASSKIHKLIQAGVLGYYMVTADRAETTN
ncbi:methyltransferase domain-containing protein [Halobacteriaceae archaeon SHR40]|uniref:SAM-dependent methyltransferase n=1 Tax=Halovenus amylolytica TaxID=2500550 RepID=UPI000FE3251C